MIDPHDLESDLTHAEQLRLMEVGEQLERDRPVPRATFRGELRRSLLGGSGSPATVAAGRWRVLVATYSGLGAVLLAVAAIGLAGAGPFAS
jgi:hypothetical protein